MAERLGRDYGGINSLAELADAHREALVYDFLKMGRTVTDWGIEVDWIELRMVMRWSGPETAFGRSLMGESVGWGRVEHLLAAILDQLAALSWQTGGGKGTRPKPLPRPGVGPKKSKHGGTTVMTLEQAKKWREQRRKGVA